MTEQDIAELAESVLRPRLGPLGLQRVDVTSGRDHDGDRVLFVAAHYREGSRVPDGQVLLDALGALHQALQKAGEDRPPYLDHRFVDAKAYDGDDADDLDGATP